MKNVKFLFILSLMGALASCEWHADLYNRYADENGMAVKCGLCDGKLLNETGACSGEWQPLEMIDLGNGYYIRKLEDDKYVCGSYDEVINSSTSGNCDDEFINRFHDDSKYSLCRGGSVCVTNESDDHIFASCNTCGQDLVRCEISAEEETEQPDAQNTGDKTEQSETQNSDEDKNLTDSQIIDEKTGKKYQCVSLMDNPKHCGTCNNQCKEQEVCQNGMCELAGEKDNCGEGIKTCYCTVDDDGNYVECFDESDGERTLVCLFDDGRNTCGLTQCSEIPNNGCQNNEQCILDKTDNKYKCGCADGFVAYNHNCYNPYSTSSCGITEEKAKIDNLGENCEDNKEKKYCDGEKCICPQGTLECNNSDYCVDILKDTVYCGGCDAENNCNLKYEKEGKIGSETCNEGMCVCPPNTARCESNLCEQNNKNEHCGARGKCSSTDKDSDNFMGIKCSDAETCVINKDGVGECQCLSPGIQIGTQCIDTSNNNIYCGFNVDTGSYSEGGGRCSDVFHAYCKNSKCVCNDGFIMHNENEQMKCVDAKSDPECCGSDCLKCDIYNGEVCLDGSCEKNCPEDNINCLGTCLSPKEAHVQRRPNTEYECDCLTVPATDTSETEIWCDDDSNIRNGCSQLLGTVEHCGICGNHCGEGYSACLNDGSGYSCGCDDNEVLCKYTENDVSYVMCRDFSPDNEMHLAGCEECEPGWGHLPGVSWKYGCNIDLMNDSEHCGAIDNSCLIKTKNAIGISCVEGVCTYNACSAAENHDYHECNNDKADGCEVDLLNDLNNCGACNAKNIYSCYDNDNNRCTILCEEGKMYFSGELSFDDKKAVENNDIICYENRNKYHYGYKRVIFCSCCDHSHYGCFTDEEFNELDNKKCWSLVE